MGSRYFSTLIFFVTLAIVPEAKADIIAEIGNAGQLPGSAQQLFGTQGATLEAITGRISSPSDVDLFLIHIFDPLKFSATTVGLPGPGRIADTQLFLFDFSGRGVYANDDRAAPFSLRSTLPAGLPSSPKQPGYYFLGISASDRDPISAGGLIFPSFPSDLVYGPSGPGGAGTLSGWAGSGGGNAGAYRINLTGADLVPEPSTWLLAGMGALGLLGYAWRRRTGCR